MDQATGKARLHRWPDCRNAEAALVKAQGLYGADQVAHVRGIHLAAARAAGRATQAAAAAARPNAAPSVALIDKLLLGWGTLLAQALAAISWWFVVQRKAGQEQRNFIAAHVNPCGVKLDSALDAAFFALEAVLLEGSSWLVEHLLADREHQKAAHRCTHDIRACECIRRMGWGVQPPGVTDLQRGDDATI
jgi:hypothetical protein